MPSDHNEKYWHDQYHAQKEALSTAVSLKKMALEELEAARKRENSYLAEIKHLAHEHECAMAAMATREEQLEAELDLIRHQLGEKIDGVSG